ncbi:MAG: hypothetical protein N2235_12830 [Fischerella sp.]|nr:hypothetical protein [Fischerella sp.]
MRLATSLNFSLIVLTKYLLYCQEDLPSLASELFLREFQWLQDSDNQPNIIGGDTLTPDEQQQLGDN